MDVQISDLDVQILNLDIQILDLDVQIWDLDVHIWATFRRQFCCEWTGLESLSGANPNPNLTRS